MRNCELCGRSMKGRGRNVEIEGAMMNVCPQCATKFGRQSSDHDSKTTSSTRRTKPSWVGRPDVQTTRPSTTSSPVVHRKKPQKSRPRGGPLIDDLELVDNYASIIRNARQKKGMNQEELAQKIGERITTLQSIEAGRLKPTRKAIRGLERELDVSLLEAVGTPPLKVSKGRSSGGPTLGDVVKVKRKKSQKQD